VSQERKRMGNCGLQRKLLGGQEGLASNGSRSKERESWSVDIGVCLQSMWLESNRTSLQTELGIDWVTQDKLT